MYILTSALFADDKTTYGHLSHRQRYIGCRALDTTRFYSRDTCLSVLKTGCLPITYTIHVNICKLYLRAT